MNILLAGSQGYIGKSIYQKLSQKYNITCLNKNVLNLSNSFDVDKWFSDKFFDVVINAASIGGSRLTPDTANVMYENLKIYYNFHSNKNKFKKFISFGSGAELFMPETFYGLSKKIIAKSIENSNNFYNLRIFAVFNENELNTRFIKSNILRYKKRESIEIHKNKLMDFFYMDDLITLIEYYIMNKNLPKTIDCSYADKYNLLEVADIINSLDNYKVKVNIKEKETIDLYCGNHINLALKYIGLKDGIKNTFKML